MFLFSQREVILSNLLLGNVFFPITIHQIQNLWQPANSKLDWIFQLLSFFFSFIYLFSWYFFGFRTFVFFMSCKCCLRKQSIFCDTNFPVKQWSENIIKSHFVCRQHFCLKLFAQSNFVLKASNPLRHQCLSQLT